MVQELLSGPISAFYGAAKKNPRGPFRLFCINDCIPCGRHRCAWVLNSKSSCCSLYTLSSSKRILMSSWLHAKLHLQLDLRTFLGYLPTLLEDVPDMAVKFAAYETMRTMHRRLTGRPQGGCCLVADISMGLHRGCCCRRCDDPFGCCQDENDV